MRRIYDDRDSTAERFEKIHEEALANQQWHYEDHAEVVRLRRRIERLERVCGIHNE